jgi:lipid-binding SYLF domain-containing protein
VVSVRHAGGTWGAPAFFTLGGGSVGLQIGGQVVDLVLLVMTEHGVDSLLRSEFTLGGDASLAAGPKRLHDGVGTDGRFQAEIFSYAKASGFFAGVSFRIYGPKADSRDVLLGGKHAAAAGSFMTALRGYAPPPKRKS